MKQEIVVNPAYTDLADFVGMLPVDFEKNGRIIYKARNEVRVFDINGLQVNVKRYRLPGIVKQLAYTYFFKTKAERAYYNAFEVIKRGFETPESIAYMKDVKRGMLGYSYYVSTQVDCYREIRELYFGPLQGNERLLEEFASYTARLHDAGVYHLDYSPGNVLIKEADGAYSFTLVDINRMKFKQVTLKEGCWSFARLFGNDEVFSFIIPIYAKKRGFSVEQCTRQLAVYRAKHERLKRRKIFFKKLIGKPTSHA